MALGRLVTRGLYGPQATTESPSITTPMIAMTYQDMSKQIRVQVSNTKLRHMQVTVCCVQILKLSTQPDCVEGEIEVLVLVVYE